MNATATLAAAAVYADQADRVRRIVAANLKPSDRHVAEDIAQDVWLQFCQITARGTRVTSPAGLLATMARRRVCDHYRSARVRREQCCQDMAAYAEGIAS